MVFRLYFTFLEMTDYGLKKPMLAAFALNEMI